MKADLDAAMTALARGDRRLPGQRRGSAAEFVRRVPRRRTVPVAVALEVAVLAGGAIAWVVVTALLARQELQAVRAGVAVLRTDLAAGQVAAARDGFDELARLARRAHGLTSGPAWAVAARIPVLGAPLRTARGIAQVGDELADGALRPLLEVARRIGSGQLRQPDGRIDVAAITDT